MLQSFDPQRNMNEFADYLEEKYDYIEKLDMLRSERDAWKVYYNLTLSQASKVWNEVYG